MKYHENNTRKLSLVHFSWLLFFVLSLGIFTACDNDDDVTDVDPVPISYVSLYNGSPDGSALDIYVDNNRINYNAFDYTDHTGYLRFYTGERVLRFTPFNAANTVLETEISLEPDSLYSVFITGQTGDREALVVHDDIRTEDNDNVLLRILHASPDAPVVNLTYTGTDTQLFENMTYRDISGFEEINAGQTSFEIRNAVTNEVVTTVSNVNFISGRVYTLVIRGFVEPPAGSTHDLGVQVVPNFFNL
ncbi:DUF4397 domain-containing protein [Marivirga sp. S37H4]|uniref:DUF4397 domain-containing protein n=1 Tax=Marivirga aurantiaca TaxID=2802615 RepID=A0A935C8R0_9BACT|nr:DUF4397 domain-containing protein [Marivirga aurantiaca]MBK6265584.1 DUF4397 domain-containing protein [Marivirga aurantiaca]